MYIHVLHAMFHRSSIKAIWTNFILISHFHPSRVSLAPSGSFMDDKPLHGDEGTQQPGWDVISHNKVREKADPKFNIYWVKNSSHKGQDFHFPQIFLSTSCS